MLDVWQFETRPTGLEAVIECSALCPPATEKRWLTSRNQSFREGRSVESEKKRTLGVLTSSQSEPRTTNTSERKQ
jgi:hypothetical protein